MQKCRWIIAVLMFTTSLSAGWLERKAEGWAWYENPEKADEDKEEQTNISATEQISQARKELENYLAEAMLNPTMENTMRYMEAQKNWMERSAVFANSWQKVLLSNPHLDPTATAFATSQYGRQLQKIVEKEEKENIIRSVAKQYGLFMFYEGNSKICKAFALVVNAFAQRYEWSVLGISVDGAMIAEVEKSICDNGIAAEMSISIFPALFAVDPQSKTIVPLAFGLKSIDQIEDSIYLQFNNNEEKQ